MTDMLRKFKKGGKSLTKSAQKKKVKINFVAMYEIKDIANMLIQNHIGAINPNKIMLESLERYLIKKGHEPGFTILDDREYYKR